jgi:hypothetical protein
MATKNAVVFSGRNGLDFMDLRSGVLRIPDVTARLREAQKILDAPVDGVELPKVDLLNLLNSEDELFFRNIKLKSLVASIVQVGLFDRFLKTQRRPDYFVGNSNGDSAMLVCAGRMSFEEMVFKSQALDTLKPLEKLAQPALAPNGAIVLPMPTVAILPAPLLSGICLTEYQALKSVAVEGGKFEGHSVFGDGIMDLKRIIAALHEEQGVTRFVSIGPAGAIRSSDYKTLGSDEIESLDSIELDPMLGWFWRNIRNPVIALAQ